MKSPALFTKSLLAVLFIFGGIMVFMTGNTALKIAGIFYLGVTVTAFSVVLGKGRAIPVPAGLKKWIMMCLILRVELFLARLFRMAQEPLMEYFIRLNNALNPGISGKTLLLLPRCIQDSECRQDLALDVDNCLRCGNCQIAEILRITGSRDLEVRLVGGGTLALEKISEIDPKSIIAVACERELIDGIRETLKIPVWAVKNLRPHGPCVNTQINMNDLKEILRERS